VSAGDSGPVSFVGRELPETFLVACVAIEPGGERPYVLGDWADALVVIEAGELELECEAGSRARFREGAVLVLHPLPLRTLRNPGERALVLTAVSRRRSDESQPRSASHQ
jgi:hypothetical protein